MKNALFVLLICVFPNFLSGQGHDSSLAPDDSRNFRLGLTTSPNLGWLASTSSSNNKPDGARIGFSYGILADLGFAKNYYFSTGFILNNLNSKSKTEGNPLTLNTNHLQYIEIPLTLKLKSNSAPLGRFFGQFGLAAGIKTRANQDYTQSTTDGLKTSGDKVNIGDETNIFRLGLIAGGGAEWNAGRNLSILTGLSYSNGFTNTFKDQEMKTSYISLNLGVFF